MKFYVWHTKTNSSHIPNGSMEIIEAETAEEAATLLVRKRLSEYLNAGGVDYTVFAVSETHVRALVFAGVEVLLKPVDPIVDASQAESAKQTKQPELESLHEALKKLDPHFGKAR